MYVLDVFFHVQMELTQYTNFIFQKISRSNAPTLDTDLCIDKSYVIYLLLHTRKSLCISNLHTNLDSYVKLVYNH